MKERFHYLVISSLFLIGTILSCNPATDLDPNPEISHKAGAREPVDASATYKYFFYANGIRHARGQQLNVRSGEHFYLELRFSPPDRPEYELPMPVNAWGIPSNNVRLVRQYSSSANEYEVIAPNILPGHQLYLGTISAAFSAFPSTSFAERQAVTISLSQQPGGIVGPWNP